MTEDRAPYAVPLDVPGLTRDDMLATPAHELDAVMRRKAQEQMRAALFGDDTPPPLVTVRCPECGKPLLRVTKGATVEVKCLKCRVWIKQQAA